MVQVDQHSKCPQGHTQKFGSTVGIERRGLEGDIRDARFFKVHTQFPWKAPFEAAERLP